MTKPEKRIRGMIFSKHCAYCVANKKIHTEEHRSYILRLLKDARGFIDAGDYEGNEYNHALAQEIDEVLYK